MIFLLAFDLIKLAEQNEWLKSADFTFVEYFLNTVKYDLETCLW
jgi:hypothetical protein